MGVQLALPSYLPKGDRLVFAARFLCQQAAQALWNEKAVASYRTP